MSESTRLPQGAGTAGEEVVPKLAASVLVLRGRPLELLFLRRAEESTFVPGAWIFPGGAADVHDLRIAAALGLAGEAEVLKVTAARELFEESGIWLGGQLESVERSREALLRGDTLEAASFSSALPRLVWTSRWITPVGMPKRYDTYFYLTVVDGSATATPDAVEGVEIAWLTPDSALQRYRDGGLPMVLPTVKNVEALRGFDDPHELIDSRRGAAIEAIQPLLVVDGGKRRIVLPEKK